jgi:ABC-type Fe3+-hydroxamate transport system substrate-binding protein
MKKLLVILAITSFLAACNNKTEESSSTTLKDSVSSESPLMDAMNTEDSVNKKIQDSTGKMMDTMMKK